VLFPRVSSTMYVFASRTQNTEDHEAAVEILVDDDVRNLGRWARNDRQWT
jgi:hypothetical protein